MRYNRVLLVNTAIQNTYLGPIRPPAGLGSIAQMLDDQGIDYDVIDMLLGYSKEDLVKRIDSFKPDLVGFSLFTFMHEQAYKLITEVKAESQPSFDIVAGGPHLSTFMADALAVCGAMDYGVVMEGEETLLDLCSGKQEADIPGLLWRDKGKVVFSAPRKPIRDLDALGFPKYQKFELSRYMLKEILILSSRGCPYRCTYCAANLVVGRKVRMRSAESVVDEIVYWHEHGYRRFNFGDDNFTFYGKRVYEFCDLLEQKNLPGLDLRCGNGIRADRVDRGLLERMRDIGFSYVAFGVEAGNDKILGVLKKGERLEHIEEAISAACELGYDVTLFFLLGSPYESWSDIEDSFRVATKYPVMDVRFYNLIPYPHTELFDWVKDNGYFVRQPEDYLNNASVFINEPIFVTPELSVADRIEALKRAEIIRKQVLRSAMERRLKRFGVIGKVGARFFSSDRGLELLRQNKVVRALAEYIRGTRA